ncbi:MAG: cob(I)yrinic acid a,c-diamide adenosyltransferase [Lysobacterales bacterium]
MGHRLSKIYTRTGDDGTTGLGDGSRVGKDSLRVEAFGTVDELNSAIGMVIALTNDESVKTCLTTVQHDLFDLGGELSIPGTALINEAQVSRLEKDLDTFNADLKPLKEFILPGGDAAAASCHLARTISRRAERRLITLSAEQPVADTARQYLNRVSDLLFVVARRLAAASDEGEILWDRERYS